MGVIAKVLNKFGYEKAANIYRMLEGSNIFVSDRFGKPTLKNYTKYLNAYADEIWVFACVHKLASTIAGLPYNIYHKKLDKNGKLIKEYKPLHPVRKLFDKPNKNDENSTWNNLMEFTVASCELTGNSYWLEDEMSGKKPLSLQFLLSNRVRIKPGKDKFIDKYIYIKPLGADPDEFNAEEIAHFKYMSPNDYYYGQSTISPARWSIDTIKEALKTNLNIFKNGARLDGVLETEQVLNDKVFERLKDEFDSKYKGTDKAHKTGILEAGLKYKSIIGSMKDLEFIKGMKLTREEVCAVFDTPPVLVGILDKATYSNYKESKSVFYEFGIIPRLKKYTPVIESIVKKYDEKAFFEFDLSGVDVLKQDHKLLSEIAKNYFGMGVPLNEIIIKLNLPFEKVKGGDVGYLPLALVPIGSPPPPSPEQEGKLLKSAEEDRKNTLWKRFDTLTRKIEKAYMKIIDRFFSRQEREMLGRMGKSKAEIDIEAVLFNEKGEVEKWAKESKKVHTVAVDENGKREIANIGADVVFDVSNPRVVRWIDKYGLEKAKEVIGNVRAEVKTSLLEGVKAGEGIPELKRRITGIYDPYKDEGYKATRIARTEVISASNEGALEAYKQSEIVEKKGWLATRDGRTRESHLAAEHQYSKGIPINEDFSVGGDSMMAPGQGGIPEENINCRCTLLPIIEK